VLDKTYLFDRKKREVNYIIMHPALPLSESNYCSPVIIIIIVVVVVIIIIIG
jgi:hypothetical protein